MATAFHNLSDYDAESVPDASGMRFGIVVSEWNSNITGALLEGAVNTLKKHGAKEENILVQTVPGSFELTFGSAQMVKSGQVDAVIAIGCVVRGDTPHFDYVCKGTTYFFNLQVKSTIFIAVMAHSSPLLPKVPPQRSSACCILFVVIKP